MIRFHDETYCPGCGRAGVVVALDSTLLEVRPEVRRHVCGLGGPGSSIVSTHAPWGTDPGGYCGCPDCNAPDDNECCASGRCEVCTPGYVWGMSS